LKSVEDKRTFKRIEVTGVSPNRCSLLRDRIEPPAQAGEEEADELTHIRLDEQARAIAASLQRRCRPGDRALVLAIYEGTSQMMKSRVAASLVAQAGWLK